jgi:transposase
LYFVLAITAQFPQMPQILRGCDSFRRINLKEVCPMAKRKRFTPEFKQQAVRMLAGSDKSPADIARELGIHRNQLYKWKEQIGNGSTHTNGNSGRLAGSEVSRLRRELEVVREERDALKKAMLVLAREVRS